MTSGEADTTHETGLNESQEKMKNVLYAASGLLSLCDNSIGGTTRQLDANTPQHGDLSLPHISERSHSFKNQAAGSGASTFPEKLMEMLSEDGIESSIAWLPHGCSFAIVNPKAFTAKVLPKYFKKTKFTSFTRKLSRWGFERCTTGPELGAYHHKLFRRDNKKLCLRMRCGQEKKTSFRSTISDRHSPKQVRFGGVQIKTLPKEECNAYRKSSEPSITMTKDELARKFDKMAIRIANYRKSIPAMPLFPEQLKCASLLPNSLSQPYSPEASSAIISAALDVLDRSESFPITKKPLLPSMASMHQQTYSLLRQTRGNQNSGSVKRASAA
mmetsp:Transcript_18560/g.25538  ORF Transcript_18560/g.25538 Transcript_18560/m.25538 type:complete len:329 (-) Transcript_18560:192-1178(-)|eukprot:CAMPEP_0185730566 /NCGR_PEP_ID=MMETSP1171-20130828/10276_1 /TAXON_ID=374046 /ORGANISM="Helicotheca tamensis, Strain CCMP826" /LENGTH=328 /DNA_ID=CAMNT_0028399641 /DNA_START=41 /DNA_END=1027 /DNA_ORIENTATION=+